jgi:Zn-dependent peptidase ImmA (M78 family)
MNHTWKQLEIKSLIKDYPNTPSKVLAERYGVSVYAIYARAYSLGIKKDKSYRASCMTQTLINNKFKKGAIPWNKGLKSA